MVCTGCLSVPNAWKMAALVCLRFARASGRDDFVGERGEGGALVGLLAAVLVLGIRAGGFGANRVVGAGGRIKLSD